MLGLFEVVESEKTAKWQYTKHCQDLTVEIQKLREEVNHTSNPAPIAYLFFKKMKILRFIEILSPIEIVLTIFPNYLILPET